MQIIKNKLNHFKICEIESPCLQLPSPLVSISTQFGFALGKVGSYNILLSLNGVNTLLAQLSVDGLPVDASDRWPHKKKLTYRHLCDVLIVTRVVQNAPGAPGLSFVWL